MARRATTTKKKGERGRFSARRKMEAILRLLRGEDLDTVSRELGVTASTLTGWRDRALAGAESSLKERPRDERDDEIRELHAKIGAITMDNELLLERARRAEDKHGFRRRRS